MAVILLARARRRACQRLERKAGDEQGVTTPGGHSPEDCLPYQAVPQDPKWAPGPARSSGPGAGSPEAARVSWLEGLNPQGLYSF
jgi:hypothetical protein